jgi:hypothetical protein
MEGVPTVFLFADTQLKQEAFLEDINNILSSGQVPNLFVKDEKVCTAVTAVTRVFCDLSHAPAHGSCVGCGSAARAVVIDALRYCVM